VEALDYLSELIPRLATIRDGHWLPGSLVAATTTTNEPYCSNFEPMVALVVSGSKRMSLAGDEFTYSAGEYLVFSLELAVTAEITRADPFLAVGIRLRPDLVAELLLQSSPEPAAGAAVGVATADGDLADAFVRLLRLVDRPADFAVLATGIEREIHWRLLTGPLGPLVRQVARSDERFEMVRRAARWMERHVEQTVRAEDLARYAGVSVATLNRRFREVTTMSPVQYQKQLRLQRARVRLSAAPGDVAAIGHEVGYESASQFSREYRRLFGVSPSQDARAGRRAEPALQL